MSNRGLDLQPSIFKELDSANTILIAGCGGGYDIYCGLPFYFYLKQKNKKVHLASYTFTDLSCIKTKSTKKLGHNCYVINSQTEFIKEDTYSPEYYLCKWFLEEQNIQEEIYVFPLIGPKELSQAYQDLHNELNYDTVILIDGGTDSLMQGDESQIGTFVEDLSSMLAVNILQNPVIKRKFLFSIGFGIDAFHGVSHYDVLSNIAQIMRNNGFLGSFSLEESFPEVRKYIQAVAYANNLDRDNVSIVQNSIVSALNGTFGNKHKTERTQSSVLFINPLMAQVWCFRLEVVCQLLKITPTVQVLDELKDIEIIIAQQRSEELGFSSKRLTLRPRRRIPL